MKHDAIVEQGIPILERVPIPDELIPEDSRVEIDAKIHAGYFTTGKVMNMAELSEVQGRPWEDVDVSNSDDIISGCMANVKSIKTPDCYAPTQTPPLYFNQNRYRYISGLIERNAGTGPCADTGAFGE
jgi:hypothetical protein